MRTCTACNALKPLKDFHRHTGNRVQPKCKSCRNTAARAWRASRLDLDRAGMRAYRQQRKSQLEALKIGRPCADCGGTFPPCAMDFDHRDPKLKSGDVSRLLGSGRPMEIVLLEVAKCELVCANCHRIRTFLQGKGKKSGDSFAAWHGRRRERTQGGQS